ncbi:hypothetical protein NJI34_08765 [Pseudomonas sp. S 311-6]|nr:hypothetical protein [Pseudomonas sp. S 311-6]
MSDMHVVNRRATHDRKALANENASATAKCRMPGSGLMRAGRRKFHENRLIFMKKTADQEGIAATEVLGQMRMAGVFCCLNHTETPQTMTCPVARQPG